MASQFFRELAAELSRRFLEQRRWPWFLSCVVVTVFNMVVIGFCVFVLVTGRYRTTGKPVVDFLNAYRPPELHRESTPATMYRWILVSTIGTAVFWGIYYMLGRIRPAQALEGSQTDFGEAESFEPEWEDEEEEAEEDLAD